MKIAFISNYFNHHQKPFSDTLYKLTNHNFWFIETKEITEERLQLGWGSEELPEYVLKNYIDIESLCYCQSIIDEADVVISGHAPYELIKNRLKNNKLTFFYTERIYKTGFEYYKWPVRAVRLFSKYNRYKNFYVLCASAYTAADFAITGTFLNRTYKWGYFTEVKRYGNIDLLLSSKKPLSVLWVGRFMDVKHPEAALYVAKRLKEDNYKFTLNLIGNGKLFDEIENQIVEYNLQDCVKLLGSMKPQEVRTHMEQSEVFLFTSDKNEGWGAVLNESLNSGCAVVASHAIGSVPFLIKDTQNGLIYKDGNLDDLYIKVKFLLDNKEERTRISKNAYLTMVTEWNPENAANKFIKLSNKLLHNQKKSSFCDEGVCSKAPILKDNWYK